MDPRGSKQKKSTAKFGRGRWQGLVFKDIPIKPFSVFHNLTVEDTEKLYNSVPRSPTK